VLTSQRSGAEAPEDDLAEHNDSPSNENADTSTGLTRTRRTERAAAQRPSARPPQRVAAPAASASRGPRSKRKPLKAVIVLAMVGGLVATAAIPAFGALNPAANAKTLQQVAAGDAQTLVVASDATSEAVQRDNYSATTPDELAKAKAEAAAAARAKASAAPASVKYQMNLSLVAPGSGQVRWPLAHVDKIGDGFLARGGEHQGVDFLDPAGTPIFAAAAGVVRASADSIGGYGVCIYIDSIINGQRVTTVYGHMIYGSRQVQVGQTVSAGQVIGAVGSTGRSTANHLHFEVHLNGVTIDPLAWIIANAGPVP
jgi:murein DD-endopeptidase MepM/ murein hydrolase activator NlpD